MRKHKLRIRSEASRAAAAKLLTFIAIMLLTVALVDLRIRPVVETAIAYQAKIFSFGIINAAVMKEMADETVGYADMVRLTRDNKGQVTAVETDIVAVNRLKSRIASTVADRLGEQGNKALNIPIGTLLGSQLTAGRGPMVSVKIIPMGYVQSELYNDFTTAGINQTLHKVMMKTTVRMVAVMPGYNVETESSTSICIAETVIVGSVPEGFTVINGDDSSNISKMNDYKAKTGG